MNHGVSLKVPLNHCDCCLGHKLEQSVHQHVIWLVLLKIHFPKEFDTALGRWVCKDWVLMERKDELAGGCIDLVMCTGGGHH